MSDFKDFMEGNGLWANIHNKRKEGRPMRKAGSKGAPTKQDFKRARSEDLEEAPLVMHDLDMIKTLFNKIENDIIIKIFLLNFIIYFFSKLLNFMK